MTAFAKPSAGGTTTAEALELFDSLEPVDTGFMIGSWQGEEFPTGHPLDGLLEAYHWYGKRFESEEEVHPLIFRKWRGGLASVDPKFFGPAIRMIDRLPIPKSAAVGRLFQLMMPPFTTRRSRARLRMTSYRGVLTATMIYDQLPISDVFRKIDEDRVLGVMDRKGMKTPFFFVLRRERGGDRLPPPAGRPVPGGVETPSA